MNQRTLASFVMALGLVQAACDEVKVRGVPDHPFQCEDEEWHSASTNPNRFIAHAAGQIDGHRYTNSREALDLAYENGLRLFEIDLTQTSDGYFVAVHDWNTWRDATESAAAPPTRRQFKETLLFKRYHALDVSDLDRWFGEKTDAYLVTDKIADFKTLLDGFSHSSRLIVEVFSVGDYHRALAQGVQHPMLALIPALANDGKDKVVELLETRPVKFVSVPSKAIWRQGRLLAALRRNRTCVYAYTSSDPEFLERNFRKRIFGAYTDHWNIHRGGCDAEVCDTY